MKKLSGLLFAALFAVSANAQTIGPAPTAPGGSTTTLQYNNAGAFGGVSGWTTNGTTTLVGGASTTVTIGAGTAITSSGPGGALVSTAFTAIGTSGATVPLLSTANTWGAVQAFPVGAVNAPSVIVGNSTTGLYSVSTTGFGIAVNGVVKFDYGISNASTWTITGATLNLGGGGITNGGSVHLNTGSTFDWNTRSSIRSPADGGFQFQLNAQTNGFLLTASATDGLMQVGLGSASSGVGGSISLTNVTAAGVIINAGITTDATHTTSTVCQDTTTHQYYFGSGALGICLGTSGRQFKNIKGPMTAGLDDIMKIKFWDYTYKDGYGDNGKRLQRGPTAQDIENVLPDLVGHDAAGEAINYDWATFLPISLRAIQQLKAEIDDLKRNGRANGR